MNSTSLAALLVIFVHLRYIDSE